MLATVLLMRLTAAYMASFPRMVLSARERCTGSQRPVAAALCLGLSLALVVFLVFLPNSRIVYTSLYLAMR
jgi:hypothetical protein